MMRPLPIVALWAALALTACLGARSPEADTTSPATGTDSAASSDAGPSPDAADSAAADAATDAAAPAPLPLLDLGAPCVASAECTSGHCAMPCEGFGVCAPATCATSAGCAIPGALATHCCVAGQCAAVLGDACGEGEGTQGSPCGSGGQSDCAAGFLCTSACVASATCAATCQGDAACEALDPGLSCFKSVAGPSICLEDPEKPLLCVTDAQCAGAMVCTAFMSWDGTGIIKMCRASVGPKGTGEKCGASNECASGSCFDTYCTGGCATDGDCACKPGTKCAADQSCLDVWLAAADGGADAAKLCYPRKRCASTADCAPYTCTAYPEKSAWATVCQPPDAAKPGGASCEAHADCKSRACHEGTCREVCTLSAQCAGGLSCQPTALPGLPAAGAELGLCR